VARGSDSDISEIKQRLALLETRMEQLFEAMDITPREPDAESDAELQLLIANGKTIDAVKRYHELTGAGLKESKDAVERLGG
jgi:ribosomal protein L7/L12